MWNTFPHVVWFVLVTKLKQANTHAKDKQKKLGCKTLLWTMSFIKTTSMLNLRHYKSFWWVYVFSAVSHQSLRNSVILYFPLETEWDQIVFWSMQMKSAPCKVKQSEAEEVQFRLMLSACLALWLLLIWCVCMRGAGIKSCGEIPVNVLG